MKRVFKILVWIVLATILAPFVVMVGLYLSADMGEPTLTLDAADFPTSHKGDSLFCGNSYLRHDSCGLWELYVEGSGQERGALQGALTKDLMKYQEDVFVNQIRNIIPSDRYLSLLRGFIVVFNRNLGEYIPLEYREEIAMMSQFCTHEYDAIGSPYERQLNYHGAHDIGHAMQQYMLVGCSSFGAWGGQTENGSMIIGRNFDFYVGDDFAKNKLLTFAVPDSGYRYASIGWAGMVGVLSGMNACGITVTINAAKGSMPTSAATPISILTREILQYASTIDEAYAIAASRHTFVSESILVGSANDGKSAIIEKTPDQTALFSTVGDRIICTNHFQSKEFAQDEDNISNIENSDSKYRYDRLTQLLDSNPSLNYVGAIGVLRNRLGLNNSDIGIGNEMTLNQSIAHHSVVFLPSEKLMWVSTEPWQSGQFVCYDLEGFFSGNSLPCRKTCLDVEADSLFLNRDYPRLVDYRKKVKEIREAANGEVELSNQFIDDFMAINPFHYYTYRVLGDYYSEFGLNSKAIDLYKRSLDCTIPYKSERMDIEKLIEKLGK